MSRRIGLLMLSASAIAVSAIGAKAQDPSFFERISTYPVFMNLPEGVDPATATVAEIVTVTPDGMTLVHSDSPGEAVGFVDITDPAAPVGAGRVDVGGEPTSVAAIGGYVFAGVNTSESFVNPTGHVAVISIADHSIVATCDVGGQPDSLTVSPDGAYLAVVIENERDEDLNDGIIPQLPSGYLAIFQLGADGAPTDCDAVTIVDLTGLSDLAPTDAEPEFVDINNANLAVVTMQENNHLVIVDLATATVVSHFDAGTVDLTAIDIADDGVIGGTAALNDVPREADAVQWLDDSRFVTANEGDYQGGSRGFTIYNVDGTIEYDAGNSFEHLAMMIGHFPEGRADNKGAEPEGVEVWHADGETLFMIGSERANFVAVYRDMGAGNAPEFIQVLPTNIGPEGLLAIPSRGLFVAASEEDAAEDNIRSTISIYSPTATASLYPQIVSDIDPATGAPFGWGALSGLVADTASPTTLYAVSDSAYSVSRIYTIDTAETPARITGYVTLTLDGADKAYDLEGIATRADGGFWVVSEGGAYTINQLLAVGEDGAVLEEIALPESVEAGATNNGFEGVASFTEDGVEKIIIAFQRAWADDAANHAKLGIYTPSTGEWAFVAYEFDAPTSPNGGWVGLSEITHLGGSRFAIIERDNQPGVYSTHKVVTMIDLATVEARPAGERLETVGKTVAVDILAVMREANGWISDKPEGLAVTADGTAYLIIDNDGVDDATGETQFINLGTATELFH